MTHKFEQSDSGNDLLRARFTLWLNITLAHAKERYLDTHTEKFNIVLCLFSFLLVESIAKAHDFHRELLL